MQRETRNDVVVHILDAQDRVIAVTACSSIGNIMSCRGAYSHRKQRRPMTGLWRASLRSGARNSQSNNLSDNRFRRNYAILAAGRNV